MPKFSGFGVEWPLGPTGFQSDPVYERKDTTGLLSGTSGFSGLPGMLLKAAGMVEEGEKAKAKAEETQQKLEQAAARGVVEDSLKLLNMPDYPNSAKKELYNRIIRKAIYDSFPPLGNWAPEIPENVPWGPHFTQYVKEYAAVVNAQGDQRSKELALHAMWGEMCANTKTAPLCKMQQDHLAAVRRDQVEVIAFEFGNILDGTATPAQLADFYAQKADAQHPGRPGETVEARLIRQERGLIITDGILLAEARRAAARKAAKEGFLPVPETSRLVDPLVLPSATPPALGGPGMAPGGVAAPAPGSAPVRIEDIGVQPSPSAATGSVLPTTGGGVVRRNRTQLTPEKEKEFRTWYEAWASVAGIDPDPDNPRHQYDYRGAFLVGAAPSIDPTDGKYHWSSEFKDQDHPTYVRGVDTTRRASPQQAARPGVVLEAAPKTVPPVQAAAATFARLRKENPWMTREQAATLALDQHGAVPEELRSLVDALVKADIAKAGKMAAETAGAKTETDRNAPLGAANAANLFNPVTRQNPPPSMSQAEADKQGFRAIPPDQIKAINLLEANFKDAYGIIRRRKDLFPPATGSQTRDAYNIAQAKVLAVAGRASGDADIQTLDSLSGMLMHINRAFGGTSKQMDSALELLRMERAFELTPKGYAAARQQLDILRDRLNGGFTASGLGPMKLEVPAGKPDSPSNDFRILNRRPAKGP